MSATLRITIGAEEQHERLREWHDKTHVMHVAHAKAAARQALLSKALAVTVAIFTAITGTTLYASWGTSPSTAARIAVSTIAVLGVVFAAAQTALTPGKHSAEHQQAAARYGKLRRQMEEWRIEHPSADAPDPPTLDDWLKAWVDIESSAPAITDRELARGERRVTAQHQANEDPW